MYNTMAMPSSPRILYCHCAYAQVVPPDVKREVLTTLSEAGIAFDAVPDLCEMSARKDPLLKQLADHRELRIAACYPRAVKWLFKAGQAPLEEGHATVQNMRTDTPEQVVQALLADVRAEPMS